MCIRDSLFTAAAILIDQVEVALELFTLRGAQIAKAEVMPGLQMRVCASVSARVGRGLRERRFVKARAISVHLSNRLHGALFGETYLTSAPLLLLFLCESSEGAPERSPERPETKGMRRVTNGSDAWEIRVTNGRRDKETPKRGEVASTHPPE